MNVDPQVLTKLEELQAAIAKYPDPRRAGEEWKQVYKLLQKTGIHAGSVTGVVGMRDVAGLVAMIEQLREPEVAAAQVPDLETCRQAMQAFRKRLSLTVLDEESKLGRGPLSKGAADRSSRAIIPPDDWPLPVWQELVRQGKLKYIGHGFYELPRL